LINTAIVVVRLYWFNKRLHNTGRMVLGGKLIASQVGEDKGTDTEYEDHN